jgi:hypothetical protein
VTREAVRQATCPENTTDRIYMSYWTYFNVTSRALRPCL